MFKERSGPSKQLGLQERTSDMDAMNNHPSGNPFPIRDNDPP